jgi:eukaryotic-like serine/threonine-protein kinase
VEQERWRQIDRLFEAALERPAHDRLAFLAVECADDEGLRAEVESLLAAHDEQDSFLERPLSTNGWSLLADCRASALPGETFRNYRIVRRLGTGGTSEVYLAQDIHLARPVAIKLLARQWAADPEKFCRFRGEALAASALNHPNILTIHEIGEWGSREFIASEFVDGATLREYIRPGNLPFATLLDFALQIARALTAAHTAGIVHRDIKPENVMVRPDGLVKVLDFGIAKYAKPPGTAFYEPGPGTATGTVIGTAAYMSPEQARGQAVDARTDIWSLGVVLYEMIAGRLPFPGATATDRIASILEREPESLRELRGDVPVRLETVVSRALAKNRDERYNDVADLAEDLGKLGAECGNKRRFEWWFRPHRRMRVWAVAIGIATAGMADLWYFRPAINSPGQSRTALSRGRISSIAVLPLANTGNTDAEYLSDGITDSLINDLSGMPELKVMSRNSVFRYKGQNVDPQKAGENLRVQAVLSGRVARSGDDLAVSVELIDARDNSQIWGERYQRKLANIFDLEQNIAREITDKLRLQLSNEERNRLARRRTNSPEAYQLYLKGQFYWFKHGFPTWRPGSAPDFGKSREFFQRAIEADPGYALAHAGLGHYYAMSAGNGLMHPEEGWPKAEAAFRKALELDPMLAEARTGLAVVYWIDHRDWAAAERELRVAIELNPNIGGGLYPRVLASEGRFDEAIAQGRRAIEFDPLSIRYSGALAEIYYYARRYSECIRQCGQTLELDPNDVWVHELLGDADERLGVQRDAIAEWRTALRLAGDYKVAATLDRAYANRGFRPAVKALASSRLRRFREMAQRGELVPAVEYARAHLRLGHKEQGLRWLLKACDEHNTFVLFLNADPFYDELRADPRFREILRQSHVPN